MPNPQWQARMTDDGVTLARREFLRRSLGAAALALATPQTFDRPKESPEELYQKALERIRESKAFLPSHFSELVERYPNSDRVHLIMGNVYLLSSTTPNKYEKAITEFTRAAELNPQLPAAYVGRGNAWLRSKEEEMVRALPQSASPETWPEAWKIARERAIAEYDAALRLDKKIFAAHYDKGIALDSMGREREAITCFDKAIETGLTIGPERPTVEGEGKTQFFGGGEPIFAMSSLWRHMMETHRCVVVDGQKIYELSQGQYFVSNENDPLAFAYYHKGVSYARAHMQDYASAVRCWTKAIELNPNFPWLYQFRSAAYARLNDGPKMLDDLVLLKQTTQRIIDLLEAAQRRGDIARK